MFHYNLKVIPTLYLTQKKKNVHDHDHAAVVVILTIFLIVLVIIQPSSSLNTITSTSNKFKKLGGVSSTAARRRSVTMMNHSSNSTTRKATTKLLITIPETIWRTAALNHRTRIMTLLQPGLTSPNDPINSGRYKKRQQGGGSSNKITTNHDEWTALDMNNPIYNFLIEYYGIKGSKGPRRLGRWSPDPSLLLVVSSSSSFPPCNDKNNNTTTTNNNCWYNNQKNEIIVRNINEDGELVKDDDDQEHDNNNNNDGDGGCHYDEKMLLAAIKASQGQGGILLENANVDDFGGTLHLKGSIPVVISQEDENENESNNNNNNNLDDDSTTTTPPLYGILYNPSLFYNRHKSVTTVEEQQTILKKLAPFQWYSSILRSTLASEPILHCHGLHEWAMQYHPYHAPPPPSAKYQSSLPLRVSRDVINETVERKGISCTHVDALRFFAPAAGPLNHHGSELQRTDQLRLEQKACVHAHMDLFKIALKLGPFLKAELMEEILHISIQARKLDVEASPYDAREYGAGIVPVETKEGRKEYRDRQRKLMEETEPIRRNLLKAYDDFMTLAFEAKYLGNSDDDDDADAETAVAPFVGQERLAKAEPGGLPWRHNPITKKEID